jgi:hypothetical protein
MFVFLFKAQEVDQGREDQSSDDDWSIRPVAGSFWSSNNVSTDSNVSPASSSGSTGSLWSSKYVSTASNCSTVSNSEKEEPDDENSSTRGLAGSFPDVSRSHGEEDNNPDGATGWEEENNNDPEEFNVYRGTLSEYAELEDRVYLGENNLADQIGRVDDYLNGMEREVVYDIPENVYEEIEENN